MQLNFNDLLRITLRLLIVPINQVQILNFRHFQVWFITCAQALSYFVLILDYILRCAMACEHDGPPWQTELQLNWLRPDFPLLLSEAGACPPGVPRACLPRRRCPSAVSCLTMGNVRPAGVIFRPSPWRSWFRQTRSAACGPGLPAAPLTRLLFHVAGAITA